MFVIIQFLFLYINVRLDYDFLSLRYLEKKKYKK